MIKKYVVDTIVSVESQTVYSDYLMRDVKVDLYIPVNMQQFDEVSLLLINDGQDLPKMLFNSLLSNLLVEEKITPLLCVGIYCGEERKREYGTAYSADFKQRGDKAGLYSKFVIEELIPFIRKKLHAPSFKEKAFAGFSLGGLSALDIVWNHPNEFSKVGIFSGSLWWRRKDYDNGYEDEIDRLMHLQILKGNYYPWLKFFFECGKLDEIADRNKNGIIDSIDDTLDLIVQLKIKGYTEQHIKYVELEDGKHDITTWANSFPEFLRWGWNNKP